MQVLGEVAEVPAVSVDGRPLPAREPRLDEVAVAGGRGEPVPGVDPGREVVHRSVLMTRGRIGCAWA